MSCQLCCLHHQITPMPRLGCCPGCIHSTAARQWSLTHDPRPLISSHHHLQVQAAIACMKVHLLHVQPILNLKEQLPSQCLFRHTYLNHARSRATGTINTENSTDIWWDGYTLPFSPYYHGKDILIAVVIATISVIQPRIIKLLILLLLYYRIHRTS